MLLLVLSGVGEKIKQVADTSELEKPSKSFCLDCRYMLPVCQLKVNVLAVLFKTARMPRRGKTEAFCPQETTLPENRWINYPDDLFLILGVP